MVRNYPFFMFPIHYQFSIIHYPLKKEMKLNLKNPIVFFDLETTGTNINTDRIVEICYLKVYPNGNEETKTMRINPEMHIPEASSAVHGIYDADVADCPTFKEVAKNVARDIEGCDLAGFNSNRFDIPVYSVVISSCRSFLLLSACLIILTQLIGENGIWLSPAVSESLCLIITLLFFLRYKSGRRAEKTMVTITENSI